MKLGKAFQGWYLTLDFSQSDTVTLNTRELHSFGVNLTRVPGGQTWPNKAWKRHRWNGCFAFASDR
jgi:hypothetical protein